MSIIVFPTGCHCSFELSLQYVTSRNVRTKLTEP